MTRFQLARYERAFAQMLAKGRALIAGKPWRTSEPFDFLAFAAKLLPDLSREEIGKMPAHDIIDLLNLAAEPAPPNLSQFH